MFLTVHATTGVIIGQQTGNIWLAFLAGFISHFLLDIIPHGDQDLIKDRHSITAAEKKFITILGIADSLIVLVLVGLIYFFGFIASPLPAAFAVAGAIVPDYINAFYIFFKLKWLKGYNEFHYRLHYVWNGFTINFPQGLVVQALFLTALLSIIFLF